MAIIIKNVSTKTLQVNDLGDGLKYGINGDLAQSQLLSPNEEVTLATTDEVKNSILNGDIKKFVDDGKITVTDGSGYVTKQAVVTGTNAAVVGLKDVVSVLSALAFVTATGAPATKTLLAITTDYTVAAGDVTTVTDQSANTLVITYLAL